MYDIIMVVGGEPKSEEHWQRLQSLAPGARRLPAKSSFAETYRTVAATVAAPHFFLVDGDNWVLDTFRFEIPQPPGDDETLIWNARNPVNGLVYGHGGIKLFPTACARALHDARAIDTSLIIGASNRFVPVTASEHRFNSGPFETWRTAFRECAKLASRTIAGMPEEFRARCLEVWCTRGRDAPFGPSCIDGARAGRSYGERFTGDEDAIRRINDYGWLRSEFERSHASQ